MAECVDATSFQVTNNQFTFTAGQDEETNCTDSYVLQATMPEGATGVWSSDHAATFEDATDPNTTVSGLTNDDDNTLTWTVTYKGCPASDKVVIKNKSVDKAIILTKPHQVCDDYVQLSAQEVTHGVGHWEIPDPTKFKDGYESTDATVYVEKLPVNSDVTFEWVVNDGNCTDRASVTVTNKYY